MTMGTKVISFKLITGEQIVAGAIDESDSTITVQEPLVLQVQGVDHNNGNLQVIFLPYNICGMIADENQITFKQTALLTEPTEVADNVKNMYIQQTTGIDLTAATSDIIA